MTINKRYIGMMVAALGVFLFVPNYKEYIETSREEKNQEEYVEDDYEKFLQEKVLPDMIKNNNKQEVCELNGEGEENLEPKEIDLGTGTIEIEEETFIKQLDELHINLNEYIGREITCEGMVYTIKEEENPTYIIGRYFEETHGDHSHENFFGIQGIYDGQFPDKDAWVKVKGIVTKSSFNGEEFPAIEIEELSVVSP